METESKIQPMEKLRAAVLTDIKLQERIVRRVTISAAFVFVVFVSLLGFIIYTITQPQPANEVTLRYIQILDSSIIEQEKLITIDREDVKTAREEIIKMQQQVLEMQKQLLADDSAHHESTLFFSK